MLMGYCAPNDHCDRSHIVSHLTLPHGPLVRLFVFMNITSELMSAGKAPTNHIGAKPDSSLVNRS